MKYRDFSVIFYNSQCENMIAITSELFHSVGTIFLDCSHAIAFHLDVFSYQMGHKPNQNERHSHNVIKLLTLHHEVTSTFLMNGQKSTIILHCSYAQI